MEDPKDPNMLRSGGAPSPKGAVALALQALPFERKRLDMVNSCSMDSRPLSIQENKFGHVKRFNMSNARNKTYGFT